MICPLCKGSGEVLERKARQIGYTLSPNEPPDSLEERLVPCPLCKTHNQLREGEMKRYQFVNWFPEWLGFYYFRWHQENSDMAYIYDWGIGFAFWEIRKWHKLEEGELDCLPQPY